jgi:hypothetical protein
MVAAAALALASSMAFAEEPDSYAGIAPLFADGAVLEVTIEAPIDALMEVRPDHAYLNGRLTYTEPDGTQKMLGVKLRTRGNYRRDPEHCNFAPILLNFKKGDVADTLFAGQDKLKLVTHCQTYEAGYEQNLLREYLAYRLLQELTSVSYGTRLFRITYLDTDGKSLTRYGFVIEDDKAVAKRNGLKKVKIRTFKESENDPRSQNLINVFQYMIGNTEYSLVNPEPKKNCCHNSDVLSEDDGPPYTPLAFDFDFSGLVSAPYAQPNPRYPIPNVRLRFYRGLCDANDILPETLQIFVDKQDAFYRIIDELEPATKRTRRQVHSYLEGFYEEISDPNMVQEQLVAQCYVPVADQP